MESIKIVETYTNALVFCCRTHQTQNVQGHPTEPPILNIPTGAMTSGAPDTI